MATSKNDRIYTEAYAGSKDKKGKEKCRDPKIKKN